MSFFFDAHFHATLKKQFANPNSNPPANELPRFSPWDTASTKDFLEGFNDISLAQCVLKPFVESSLISQSSFQQMTDSGYKLAVMALFAPDKGLIQLIVNNKQFIQIVRNGKFGDYLVAEQFEFLRTTTNAFGIVKRDLELINLPVPGKSVLKLLDGQFNPVDADPLALVFSIEGLHSLQSDLQETDPQKIIADILANLDSITGENRVITINIAHIDGSNAVFANQAYAMDGFREAGFIETNLRPQANGLTPAGREIAAALYKREVLPDLKHMSWLSRRQFYQFRKEKGITAPLVCSHAGFTGCWFNNPVFKESISDFIIQMGDDKKVNTSPQHRVVLSRPNPYLTDSRIGFNASSINLFNEDIRAIFESNGLIGLSLDQRILGYSEFEDDGNVVSKNVVFIEDGLDELKLVTDSDFISDSEFQLLGEYRNPAGNLDKIRRGVITTNRMTGNSTDTRDFFHPRHFYLQVVHAMEVARMIGQLNNEASGEESVRKMLTGILCIGSDFDGLIDGLDCCANVTGISSFKNRFTKEFGRFLKEVNVALPGGLTVEQVADRIFYENGRDFVLRRLKALGEVKQKDVVADVQP